MPTHVPHASHQPAVRGERDEHAMFRAYRETGDEALRAALIERYTALAIHLARRHPAGGETEDVQQVALIGLMKAVDRFDPELGYAFTTFATPTIVGEVKRYFRDLGWAVRVPRALQERSLAARRSRDAMTSRMGREPTAAELAGELGCSLEDVLEALACTSAHYPDSLDRTDPGEDDAPIRELAVTHEPGFARLENISQADALLSHLSEEERIAVVLRFRDDLLQREIAARLGVSQMQVSRLLRSALERLRRIAAQHAEPGADVVSSAG